MQITPSESPTEESFHLLSSPSDNGNFSIGSLTVPFRLGLSTYISLSILPASAGSLLVPLSHPTDWGNMFLQHIKLLLFTLKNVFF
jgi:hypothetical protein